MCSKKVTQSIVLLTLFLPIQNVLATEKTTVNGHVLNTKNLQSATITAEQYGHPVKISTTTDQQGKFQLTLPASWSKTHAIQWTAAKHNLKLKALSFINQPIFIDGDNTVRFALADQDKDGQLNPLEQTQYQAINAKEHDNLRDALHAVLLFDATLRYPNTWSFIQALAHQPKHETAFRVLNQKALIQAHQALNPKTSKFPTQFNQESKHFLRLDNAGKPLAWQHLAYKKASWSCVDHFARIRPWGARYWQVSPDYAGRTYSREEGLQTIYQLNQQQTCQKANWRLPTQDELLGLVLQKKDKKTEQVQYFWRFPKSLPFNTLNHYWIQNGQGEPAVFDLRTQQLADTQDAHLLPLSFTQDDPIPRKANRTENIDLARLREAYERPREYWPKPTVDQGTQWQEIGTLPAMEFPQDNPYSTAKVALGKKLFFDKRFSKNGNVACASCHIPAQYWTDPKQASIGTHGEKGSRNAMPIVNVGYFNSLFWDGRVKTLEEQSIHPVQDPKEMALTKMELLTIFKAAQDYKPLLTAAFGSEEANIDRFKKAVATFERTLISRPSAIDQFLAGNKQALNNQELWGMHLFRTKARCMNCHSGALLTDNTFRNTGLTYYGRKQVDNGLFNQTFKPEDMGAFRVPSLRDIRFSAPYMHNGFFGTLARQAPSGGVFGVLAMYNHGMTINRPGNYPQYQYKFDPFFPQLDKRIQPLGLSGEEMMAVAAFLNAASAPPRQDSAPLFVLQNPKQEIKTAPIGTLADIQ